MSYQKRAKRRKEVLRAGAVIDDLLVDYSLAGEVRRHRVVIDWREIMGPRIAARTWPSPVQEDGVLWIRVSNSSWLHQLSFLRDELLARINERYGDPPVVSEIRLHIGRRRDPADAEDQPSVGLPRRQPPRPTPLPPPASGARLARIEAEARAAGIDDEELRAAIVEARRLLDL